MSVTLINVKKNVDEGHSSHIAGSLALNIIKQIFP